MRAILNADLFDDSWGLYGDGLPESVGLIATIRRQDETRLEAIGVARPTYFVSKDRESLEAFAERVLSVMLGHLTPLRKSEQSLSLFA